MRLRPDLMAASDSGTSSAENLPNFTTLAIRVTSQDGSSPMLQSTPISVVSPGRTKQEFSNRSAFAALKEDGSVITWGRSSSGGDSSSVAEQLSSGVVQIFSNGFAFAALKDDDSVVTWGTSGWGGDSSSVADQLSSGVIKVFSNSGAFSALKDDGSIVTWGSTNHAGDSSSVADQLSSGVVQIFSTVNSFAALKDDGSVISWGESDWGGDSSRVADQLKSGVVQLFSTHSAFAALKDDGSVILWGSPSGGDSTRIFDQLSSGVVKIFSTVSAFAALKDDGSVMTWGISGRGGDSSKVSDHLFSGVVQIFSSQYAFAALKADGSVITWGASDSGGDSSSVADQLRSGVAQIFSSRYAFAALKDDGSVITWGSPNHGGDSSSVADQLSSGVDQIFSSGNAFATTGGNAFAALKDDGSVITWGNPYTGGDSSVVADQLRSGVVQIFSTGVAFSALKDDGSVVTWGDPTYGGDSSSVADQLKSGVVSFADPFRDDRLILDASNSPVTSEPLPALSIAIVDNGDTVSTQIPNLSPDLSLIGDAPTLLHGYLRGSEVILQFDSILSDALPSGRRFMLRQSNRLFQVVDTNIRAADGLVTLSVENELDPTVSLKLDYFDLPGDQSQGVIESATGVDLESFSGFSLNNQGTQENSLMIDEGDFEGNQITLLLSAPISDAIPSKRRFKVKSANKKQKILDVSTEPDDGIILLTTKKNLDFQKSIFVSYKDLTGDQVDKVVEDSAGNDMATIQDFEIVAGGNDAIAPEVSSATLNENTLTIEFDSIIRNTLISKKRFKVKVNGKRVAVLSTKLEQDDSYVDLSLKPKKMRTIDINSTVTLAYKDSRGDQSSKVVEDLFGNDLDSFSGYGVEIVKI